MKTVRKHVLRSMARDVGRAALNYASMEEVCKVSVPCDPAETDDDPHLGELTDLIRQMRGTVSNLFRQRLVTRWGTADNRGYPGMLQLEPVKAIDRLRLVRKSEFVEDGIHEGSRAVPGEGSAGTVCPMSARCQAKDKDASLQIAKARNGAAPIDMVLVRPAASLGDRGAIGSEARTTLTVDDGQSNGCSGQFAGRQEYMRDAGRRRGSGTLFTFIVF